MSLNELLPEYAPKTYAHFGQEVWDQCAVDGEIYLFPKVSTEFNSHGVLIREDLRVQYDLPEIKTMDDLGAYMAGIKANEPDLIPFNTQASTNPLSMFGQANDFSSDIGGRTSVTYRLGNPSELFSYVFTDEYEAFVNRQRDWYNQGYWSASVLSEKSNNNDFFKMGLSAVNLSNIPTAATTLRGAEDNGFEAKYYVVEGDSKIERTSYKGNGYALSMNAANAERAVMFLELVNQDQEVYDAIIYGIEGVTYALTAEGQTTAPEGVPVSDTGILNLGMGVGNTERERTSASFPEYLAEIQADFNARGVAPDLGGFIFDPSNVSAEIAALANVYTQYQLPLNWGVTDPATALPELRKMMLEAGLETLMAEAQKQVDAYLAQ